MEEQKTKYWPFEEYERVCGTVPTKYDGVGLENIGGFSLIVVFGVISAGIALFFEYFRYRNKNSAQVHVPPQVHAVDQRINQQQRISNVEENLTSLDRAIVCAELGSRRSSLATDIESLSSGTSQIIHRKRSVFKK